MRPARIRPASTLLASVRTVIPLTVRGALLTLLAAALLAEGLARADLAALFWGASFILYSVYAIVASHFCRIILERGKKTRADFLSVLLPSSGLSPGETGEAHVSAHLPQSLPPGFIMRFALPLAWHDRMLDSVAGQLPHGKAQRTVRFRAGRRGMYRSTTAVLEVRDVLGFTMNPLPVPLTESLTVFPSPAADGPWRILAEGENPAASTSRRRRSDELLEVRKYYPGDDVRRLNWKVFAHSRELFLRVGEETPPPESQLLVVLDSSANPLIPRQLSDDYLDGLVDSCASAMLALMSGGMSVLLCRHGTRECYVYSEEARTELLNALADVWWAGGDWRPELPFIPHLHCAVFSTPGSPGLAGIMTQVRDRGWSASLFFKEPPRAEDMPRLRLRDLLFVPEARDRDGNNGAGGAAAGGAGSARGAAGNAAGAAHNGAGSGSTTDALRPRNRASELSVRRARGALSDALARDLAEYRGPGWKVSDAREI